MFFCAVKGTLVPPHDVKQAVQPVLDEMALKYNMSFSFGFRNAFGRVALAAGVNSVWLASTAFGARRRCTPTP